MENMNKYLKYKILKENVNRIFTNIKLLEIDGAFNQKRWIYIYTHTQFKIHGASNIFWNDLFTSIIQ